MKVRPGSCLGFIPARGGSKSVPQKNLTLLAGRPLIDYCITSAKASLFLNRIICSTDSHNIIARCMELGINIDHRPESLAEDNSLLFDVLAEYLLRTQRNDGFIPEIIALIQPTSPFLLVEHIDGSIKILLDDQKAASTQTVIECPHNHHAYNQRLVESGRVSFRFPGERRQAYNKQKKPKHYLFGNIVVFRVMAALEQGTVFAEPSLANKIHPFYGFDCDGPDDFMIGEAMLTSGLVSIPIMHEEVGTKLSAAKSVKAE